MELSMRVQVLLNSIVVNLKRVAKLMLTRPATPPGGRGLQVVGA
jgi:hypothetical protein